MSGQAELRFYAELRDFLGDPSGRLTRRFDGAPSVKDLIESSGVPHTEVDLVLVDGEPVDFAYRMRDGDRVSVYPVFESFDIRDVTKVRSEALRTTRFVLDVHLGRLARYLRLLGFDTDYDPRRADRELVRKSVAEHRILLTRDVELLKHGELTHGAFVRATDPRLQLLEVVARFQLGRAIDPFSRCMTCNGTLAPVAEEDVEDRLPDRVRRHHDRFWSCRRCDKLNWRGSHLRRLEKLIEEARGV